MTWSYIAAAAICYPFGVLSGCLSFGYVIVACKEVDHVAGNTTLGRFVKAACCAGGAVALFLSPSMFGVTP